MRHPRATRRAKKTINYNSLRRQKVRNAIMLSAMIVGISVMQIAKIQASYGIPPEERKVAILKVCIDTAIQVQKLFNLTKVKRSQ
jgi:hypothetical protein